jgi:hypothetical protein
MPISVNSTLATFRNSIGEQWGVFTSGDVLVSWHGNSNEAAKVASQNPTFKYAKVNNSGAAVAGTEKVQTNIDFWSYTAE